MVANFQHTLKGVQGGDQERGTLIWENWQNRPSDSERFSRESFFFFFNEPGFLHLPILRKALKPLTKISAPHD